jgi:zinc protease
MKKIISLAFTLAFILSGTHAFSQVDHAPQARLESEAAGLSSYRLDNGFKIILIPFSSANNTRVELLVRSGSKFEGYGETGMAHLLEHMLFKGAGNRKNIKDDLTKLGASYNGTTTADRTNYFESVEAAPVKVDELIRLEADRFIRARFTAADLASEMTVVRNELENSEREPSRVVLSALARSGFNWHGYARSTIGARSDIEGASFTALQAFHRKHYRPDNAALIVSGSFDKARVLSLASKLFSAAKNPSSEGPANWTLESPEAATHRTDVSLSAGVTVVASAWKLPSMKERDAHALELGAAAMCDSDWGSLRKDIVLDRKLAVSASCFTWTQSDYSRFIALAKADQNANADDLSNEVIQHIQAAAARGTTQESLERARLSALNDFEKALDSHESVADLVSQSETAGDWRLFLWTRDVIASVTLDEANQALKKWVVPLNRSDVLLRHAEKATPLEFPKPTDALTRVTGQVWPSILTSADPPPKSLREISKATHRFELDAQRAQAALITRKTQGDKVWMAMENDYGNSASLNNRKTACDAASALMKFGGNGLDRDALSARMEKLQATWQLSLDGLGLEVPRKNFAEAFETLFMVWADPSMPVQEFERYKASQIAAYQAALMDPIKVADSEVRMRFDNYPDGHASKPKSLTAQISDVKNLSYAETLRCAREFAKVSHTRIGVVGNLTAADLKEVWAKTGALKLSHDVYARVPSPKAPIAVNVTPIKVVMPDTTKAMVTGTAVIPLQRNSDDFAALQLAVYAMGGNSSSLIWTQLREVQGLAYSSGMQLAASSFDDRSTVVLYATSSSANADKALSSLKSVLTKVLEDGFSAAQIEQAKAAWFQRRKSTLGDESGFARKLAEGLYTEFDFAAMAKLDDKIAALSHSQATAAIKKYLSASNLVWSTGQGN